MSYKCCNKSTERLLPWYTVDHIVKATDIISTNLCFFFVFNMGILTL